MDISVPGVSLDIDPRGLNASQELPDEFPFNLDYNSGNTTGFSESSMLLRFRNFGINCIRLDAVDCTYQQPGVCASIELDP